MHELVVGAKRVRERDHDRFPADRQPDDSEFGPEFRAIRHIVLQREPDSRFITRMVWMPFNQG
ncbi:hypothetical protein D1872_318060 [compost metagenome]